MSIRGYVLGAVALLTFLFCAASAIAAGVERPPEREIIKDQYTVVLKKEDFRSSIRGSAKSNKFGESVNQVAERLLRDVRQNQIILDGQRGISRSEREASEINRIRAVYSHALSGFTAILTQDAVRGLEKNPEVDFIVQDHLFYIDTLQTPTPSWGLDRIDQRDLGLDNSYEYEADGTGVHVFILDTGIDHFHSEFEGRIEDRKNFVNDGSPFDTTDCLGHGTHVAGIAAGKTVGVARNSTIHVMKVTSKIPCSGTFDPSDLISAINDVVSRRVNGLEAPIVMNMSLSGPGHNGIDAAVNGAISAGITVVVSAGNNNWYECNFSPARVPGAITVAASTPEDDVWLAIQNGLVIEGSNRGPCIDIFAPGSTITSAAVGGGGFQARSGTSMAAPHVAGTAALFLQHNPTATPDQVQAALISASTPGKIKLWKFGDTITPNRLLYTKDFGASPPPPPPPPPPPQGSDYPWLVPVLDLLLN